MGVFGGRYSSSCNRQYDRNDNTAPNPNKFKFSILRVIQGKNDLVFLEVHYPDCITYDGIKYIVMNSSLIEWSNFHELDPHFIEGNNVIARFAPTQDGYGYAMNMIGM